MVLSVLTWWFVEQPGRRLNWRPPRLLLAAGGCAVTLAAGSFAANAALRAVHSHESPAARIEALASDFEADPCLLRGRDPVAMPPERCLSASPRRVALVGDSHAAVLGKALKEAVVADGFGLMRLTRSACPPMRDVTRSLPAWPRNAADCAAHNSLVHRSILDDPAIRMVVLTGFWSGSFANGLSRLEGDFPTDDPDLAALDPAERVAEGAARLARDLVRAGRVVVVIGDVPLMPFEPAKRALATVLPAREALGFAARHATLDTGRVTRASLKPGPALVNAALRRRLQGIPGLVWIDPHDALCDQRHCRYMTAGELLYIDNHHVSVSGARIVLKRLAEPPPRRFSTSISERR